MKFPPLWRKAWPPEPVEAYREQPGRFPPVWGFKDYDWVEWTQHQHGDGAQFHRALYRIGQGKRFVIDAAVRPRVAGTPDSKAMRGSANSLYIL